MMTGKETSVQYLHSKYLEINNVKHIFFLHHYFPVLFMDSGFPFICVKVLRDLKACGSLVPIYAVYMAACSCTPEHLKKDCLQSLNVCQTHLVPCISDFKIGSTRHIYLLLKAALYNQQHYKSVDFTFHSFIFPVSVDHVY